jgi:hypothetical protein
VVSPEKLDYAIGEVFPPNIYSAMAGWAWEQMFGKLTLAQQRQSAFWILAHNPVTKRFFKMTSKRRAVAKSAAEYEMDADSVSAGNTANLETMYEQYKQGMRKYSDLLTFNRMHAISKEEEKRLDNHLDFLGKIDRLKEKAVWSKMDVMSKLGRSRFFLNEYLQADKERRVTLWKEARLVPGMSYGDFISDVFKAAVEVKIKPTEVVNHPRLRNDLDFNVQIPELIP